MPTASVLHYFWLSVGRDRRFAVGLSGALTLLTPCVFPMVPITVSFLRITLLVHVQAC